MSFLRLGDWLDEVSSKLADFEETGLVMDGETVREFGARLKEAKQEATDMECEISKHRWNGLARAEREAEAAVLAEAARPGTNLRLLSRPGVPFSDGGTAA